MKVVAKVARAGIGTAQGHRRLKTTLTYDGGRTQRYDYDAVSRPADFLGSVTGEVNTKNSDVENVRPMTPCGRLLSGAAFVNGAPNWVGAHGYRYGNHPFTQVYVWHRVYALQTSQWTTRDLLWSEEWAYRYVNGNPVMWVDPSGLYAITNLHQCRLSGLIIRPEPTDTGAVVVGGIISKPRPGRPGATGHERLPAKDCRKGYTDSRGRRCVCVNGSFFDFASGFPAGITIGCDGKTTGTPKPGWVTVNPPGIGQLQGKPPSAGMPRPGEAIGRTGSCVGPIGRLVFLVVVDDSRGATAASFLACMSKLCNSPNKIAILDGSGSSQVAEFLPDGSFKHRLPGDKRAVSVWIVLCTGGRK